MSKIVVVRHEDLILTIEYVEGEPCKLICSKESSLCLGDIFVGRVSKVKDDLKAVFVDICPGVTGYLPYEQLKNKVKQGDLLAVTIVKEPVKTKGYSLSSFIEISGKYVVFSERFKGISISSKKSKEEAKLLRNSFLERIENAVPYNERQIKLKEIPCDFTEYGITLRTNSSISDMDMIVDEFFSLGEKFIDILEFGHNRTLYSSLYKEMPQFVKAIYDMDIDNIEEIVCADRYIYDAISVSFADKVRLLDESNISINALYRVNRAIDLATSKKVNLDCGGYLIIEPTEALTVIDVNSGKCDLKKNRSNMIKTVNSQAANEVARQLILRNISGMILVDFINMESSEDEEELVNLMKSLLKKDRVKSKVYGFSALKLMEISRQKNKASIYDFFKC